MNGPMNRLFVLSLAFVASLQVGAGLLPSEIGIGWTNGWVREWHRDVPGLKVCDSRSELPNGLVRIVRRWTWDGSTPLKQVTLGVRYRVPGDSRRLRPFIPGVLLYGNPSNKGRTDGRVPVFAGEKGEFAIFEEHRLPMPFTLLEDSSTGEFAAIHTLPSPLRGEGREDLWWSMGVEVAEGGTDIVMLSGPVGYNRRRSVVKARQRSAMVYDNAYITLHPGQVVEKTFWIQTGRSAENAFGFEKALDASLDIFRPYDATKYASMDEIVRSKRKFALSRWVEGPVQGACGFDMYDLRFKWRHLTLGWCGCAATCGYALPVLDRDPDDWVKAQRSLDFLCDVFTDTVETNGLFCVTFDMNTGETYGADAAVHDKRGGDPVSCGQALYSILKAIRFAEKPNVKGRLNTSKWRRFAEKVADAMACDILSNVWKEPLSTGPGFMVAPLTVASEIFGKERYLAAAKKLAAVFEHRYFGYDEVYWGGTLDASCEDKEGAYAAFQGYVELLRHAVRVKDTAAERKYSRLARHSMNMMLTYTMVWDATYPPGRLSDHAFKSTGWTVVSAQNQHLDAFGVLTTPEIWWMGDYLKDDRLKKLAGVMYRTCFQLTDSSGSLGEQIQHTNFAQQGDMSDVRKLRGGYAERWTVFWLTAHFLNAAAQFAEMGVDL